jgi:glutathione S-transferase
MAEVGLGAIERNSRDHAEDPELEGQAPGRKVSQARQADEVRNGRATNSEQARPVEVERLVSEFLEGNRDEWFFVREIAQARTDVNVTRVLRVYRIPFSTNVERVSLALAHKGLEVAWEDVDPPDRSPVERVSGQSLVPVLVDDGRVVTDSTVILRYLEDLQPEPAIFPTNEARRAELDVFLDWFNRVWKGPPNEIEAERGRPEPDDARIEDLGRELAGSLDVFERMLAERDYLFGEFSAADCAAFPFLKYGLIYDEEDTEEFHLILREYLALDGPYPRLEAWIRRVDARPRA